MKKVFFAIPVFLLASFCIFPENFQNESPQVQFIKGSIYDKIAAVKRSPDSALAKDAVDFVIQNSSILKNDRDLAGLALAGILSYPVQEYKAKPSEVLNEFTSLFYGIDDTNVRVSILDRLSSLYAEEEFTDVTAFVNGYLSDRTSRGGSPDETVKKSVEVLGKIGNGSSFGPLYSILKAQVWPEIHPAVNDALTQTADKSLNQIVSVVNEAGLVELKLLFQIYAKNDKISSTLRCEIAEKMLNRSMIIAGATSLSKDVAEFQLENAKILSENQWTRASELGKAYFTSARVSYEGKYLSEKEWTEAIACVQKLSSREAVKPFSDYMEGLNNAQKSGNPPERQVVLAVINALGELGDKSAFDCLLVVTYLDYPDDVTACARNALTRLKW